MAIAVASRNAVTIREVMVQLDVILPGASLRNNGSMEVEISRARRWDPWAADID